MSKPNLDHPWRWLAFQMIYPISVIVVVCVAWSLARRPINVLDAVGGAMIVFACWEAMDRLRSLADAYREALRSLKPTSDGDS